MPVGSVHVFVPGNCLNQKVMKSPSPKLVRSGIAIIGLTFISSGSLIGQTPAPQQAESQVMTTTKETSKIPNEQLDSLVAPIALYPDQLLSQTLVACTYPLEVVQLQQWLEKN